MLSSSASVTFSFGAPEREDVHFHVAAKRLIGQQCSVHQAWLEWEGRSGGLLGTQAAASCHALLFLAAGGARGHANFVVVAAEEEGGTEDEEGGACSSSVASSVGTSSSSLLWLPAGHPAGNNGGILLLLVRRQPVLDSFGGEESMVGVVQRGM